MLPVENVSDYPSPPEVQSVPHRLTARFKGVPIADTDAGQRLIETGRAPTYFFPPADIVMSALVSIAHETTCPVKGRAIYYDLVINGRRARAAAWSFPAPTARYEALRNHIAFFATALDAAHVGELKVIPQPGDLHGGWVTPNLTGRIKGVLGRG
ncbi:DUF427 domain-containing protein [Gymnodinialimonas ceratoperidinii]|uniref:DUF427 domain-containing protein n=1 Tax=Gymnodinialimonas ceratoperidinii TaxID=2856823 RepID=A0A8F6TX58_9RHOB|nr:DUF427 domain-containing protein [Gymnodinialimonas ceratoperidinii]QXT40571.1 DUF427 domain-containing protein [Gymnodinialimonas ceratoperidinii]